MAERGADELDLGDGHRLRFSEYKDEPRVGADVMHPPVEGKCSGHGWIAFEGRAWALEFHAEPIQTWKVESEEPLTLSPSILCRACGDHGYIRNGRWEKA